MAKNNQEKWVVVLGDQVSSRGAADRQAELQAVRDRVDRVNRRLADRLAVPLSVSRGDEIQALVADPLAAWDVIEAFDEPDASGVFRFAIGVGGLATGLAATTWDMDGPCFHHARDAMERAKREKRWVAVKGFGDVRDAVVDGVIRSLQVVRGGWTERQGEAYAVRRRMPSQQDAAAEMNLDQSTLSKMLKSAHYKAYLETERALRDLMRLFFGSEAPTESNEP